MDVAAGGQVRDLVQNIEREALIGILRLDRSIGDLFDDDGGGVALVARGHGHFVTQHELGKAQRTFEITDVDQPDHASWNDISSKAGADASVGRKDALPPGLIRSEEHTSELQSLMRISY